MTEYSDQVKCQSPLPAKATLLKIKKDNEKFVINLNNLNNYKPSFVKKIEPKKVELKFQNNAKPHDFIISSKKGRIDSSEKRSNFKDKKKKGTT